MFYAMLHLWKSKVAHCRIEPESSDEDGPLRVLA
jgi:hypothetical protein